MSLFAKVASLVRPPTARQEASRYGLSKDEITSIRELTLLPGWTTFGDVIDEYISAAAEGLLSPSPEVEVDFLRGRIAGMRETYMLAHMIISESDLDEQRRRTDDERSERRRRQSLYATPGWREQFAAQRFGGDGV